MQVNQDRVEKALEQRARRKAKGAGYVARKSRKNLGSADNYGQFMLVEASTNRIEAGERFDLGAEEVIAFCS